MEWEGVFLRVALIILLTCTNRKFRFCAIFNFLINLSFNTHWEKLFLKTIPTSLQACTKSPLWFCALFSFEKYPLTCTHWERAKMNPNRKTFLTLQLCTNQTICFCAIFSFKNPLHYYPPGSGFCYPILRKNYFLSLIPNGRDVF